MVNWWFGARWFRILGGYPQVAIPFIRGSQIIKYPKHRDPKHQPFSWLAIYWKKTHRFRNCWRENNEELENTHTCTWMSTFYNCISMTVVFLLGFVPVSSWVKTRWFFPTKLNLIPRCSPLSPASSLKPQVSGVISKHLKAKNTSNHCFDMLQLW